MIVEIKAEFRCDNCNYRFRVGLDPAYVPPANWSLFEVAEDRVRGDGDCSVDDWQKPAPRHLCASCTREWSEKFAEQVDGDD